MGVRKASISKFLIGNISHVKLSILSACDSSKAFRNTSAFKSFPGINLPMEDGTGPLVSMRFWRSSNRGTYHKWTLWLFPDAWSECRSCFTPTGSVRLVRRWSCSLIIRTAIIYNLCLLYNTMVCKKYVIEFTTFATQLPALAVLAPEWCNKSLFIKSLVVSPY